MSYLDTPRICFAGRFQVDVSTINNDVRYYDNAAFQPDYQKQTTDGTKGGWNPAGTAIFRLVDCRILGARLRDKTIVSPREDAVIGMRLQDADDRVFGKLGDLDPQQQLVSQIWGMRLRLTDVADAPVFAGDYKPIAFSNLWKRQQTSVLLDQTLASVYQSVLEDVAWGSTATSPVLDALRRAAEDGQLSIAMNVYGFARDPGSPRYTFGKVNGAIGPYRRGEPKHFVKGRQMTAVAPANDPFVPPKQVYWFSCNVDEASNSVAADFGNCLTILDGEGGIRDIGPLFLCLLKNETSSPLETVDPADVVSLGQVRYLGSVHYAQTALIQDFPYPAGSWIAAHIGIRPLLLVSPLKGSNRLSVVNQETLGGYYIRADDFVYRLEPGASAEVDFFATRYGRPTAGTVKTKVKTGPMGGSGTNDNPLNPPVKIPAIATPADAIAYPASFEIQPDGRGKMTISARAAGPGGVRGYIDGQLYGIGYDLAAAPPGTISTILDFISVLVFDKTDIPDRPSWYAHVKPILQQYANLYPIMSRRMFDLADYDSVVKHLPLLTLAFSLPQRDPNHMPVTRDMSNNKRAIILKWMASLGADGLPWKGDPADAPPRREPTQTEEPVFVSLSPEQARSKSAVIIEYLAREHLARTKTEAPV